MKGKLVYQRLFPGLSSLTEDWSWLDWGMLMFALVIRAFAPKLAPLGFAYYGAILVGSVLLGWHYFVDGVAGTVVALLAWYLAGRWSVEPVEGTPQLESEGANALA